MWTYKLNRYSLRREKRDLRRVVCEEVWSKCGEALKGIFGIKFLAFCLTFHQKLFLLENMQNKLEENRRKSFDGKIRLNLENSKEIFSWFSNFTTATTKKFMKKTNRNIQMRKHNVESWIFYSFFISSDSEFNTSTMSRLFQN